MFSFKHKTEHGSFSIKLNRAVDVEDMQQLVLLAHNILSDKSNKDDDKSGSLSPEESSALLDHCRTQYKLCQNPVSLIKLGNYKEPETGVKIRILSLPEGRRWDTVKMFVKTTGLPMIACKEIVFGNFPSVRFTPEVAAAVMANLPEFGVYAKVVPGDAKTWNDELKSKDEMMDVSVMHRYGTG